MKELQIWRGFQFSVRNLDSVVFILLNGYTLCTVKSVQLYIPLIHKYNILAAFKLKCSFYTSTTLFQNILLLTAYTVCTFLNSQPNAIAVEVNKPFFTLKYLISETIIINVTN